MQFFQKLFSSKWVFPTAFLIAFIAFLLSLFAPMATPDTVVVAFDTAGGTPVEMVNVSGGGRLTTLPSTSKEGYTFEGWLKGTDTVTLQTVFTTNTTVRADFEVVTFTIVYDTNGGSELNDEEVEYGDTLRLPTPTKVGAIFQGWYTDQALTQLFDDTLEITQDYTLYAKWATLGVDLITVSFFSDGLGLIGTETVAPNTTITLPIPTRTGYTFQHWVDGNTLEEVVGATTVVTTSTIFFAEWTSDAGLVTITFDTQGGTPVAPIQVPAGSTWSNPESVPFLSEGYQFLNWITDCNYDGFEVTCVTLDGNYVIEDDMTALARYDYMIPLQTMRFESYVRDERVIGYELVSVGDFTSDETISTLILPSRFSGLPVLSIGSEAFRDASYLDKVIIPENVQFINYAAFNNSSIKEVFLPDSLLRISSDAFLNTPLEMVHFGTNSSLDVIGSSAFSNTQLTQFDIPKTVSYLGGSVFEGTPLETVNFGTPSRLKYMGSSAFASTALTSVIIPEGLKHMSNDAFAYNSHLTSIALPASLVRMDDSVFLDTSLSAITFGANSQLERIGRNIFGNDGDFVPYVTNYSPTEDVVVAGPIAILYQGELDDVTQDLVIPSSVRAISNTFLDGATVSVRSLSLPANLKFIGDYAFDSISLQQDLAIPDGVEIDNNAFMHTTIAGDLTIGAVQSIDSEAFSNLTAEDVTFLPNAFAAYENDNESNIQVLGSNLFFGATIDNLVVGEGYRRLQYNFTQSSNISTISLPSTLQRIDSGAIGSSTLTSLTIAGDDILYNVSSDAITNSAYNSPWGVAQGAYTVLRNNLVRINLNVLTSPYVLEIPDHVRVINRNALLNIQPIQSIDFNQTEFIRDNAFYRWNNNLSLSDPVIVSNLSFFGSGFANNEASLFNTGSITLADFRFDSDFFIEQDLSFPENTLRNAAQFDTEGFRILGNVLLDYDPAQDTTPNEITIPSTIEVIAPYAMDNITFTAAFELPEGLRHIGRYAFSNSSLVDDDITLPSTLKYLEYGAFYNVQLNDIVIPASVKFIDSDVFYGANFDTFTFEDASRLDVAKNIIGSFSDSFEDLSSEMRQYVKNGWVILDGVLLAYYGYKFNVVIPDGVVNIASNAFEARSYSVRTMTMPETLRYLNDFALSTLYYIESIDFTAVTELEYLGRGAFEATSLRNITIEAPIEVIHPEALINMYYLETYSLNMVHSTPLYLTTSADLLD
jgi:uncharacterized repeat protein (TIGR02543 family)